MSQDALFEMPEELHPAVKIYPKDRTKRYQQARVLILVKARPEPSTSYGDTVCVAGIRVDQEEYSWIRLYPIPFRNLETYQQFKKYTFVNVPVIPASNDFRSESYKPDRGKLEVEPDKPLSLKQRLEYIKPLISDLSMCEILSIARSDTVDKQYPSLAIIRPRKILGLDVHPFKGWTKEQCNAIQNSALQGDLVDILNGDTARVMLEEPRFETHLQYLCATEDCNGHSQLFLDWELEAFSRRLLQEPEQVAIEKIRARWDSVLDSAKEPVLYVGNQHKAALAYSVLGAQRTK